jgi:hypothetical protein
MADSGAARWQRQAIYCTTALNMAGPTPRELRDAASAAHKGGKTVAAIALYKKIIVLFPATSEAVDAAFYLSGIGKGASRSTKRAAAKKTGSGAP